MGDRSQVNWLEGSACGIYWRSEGIRGNRKRAKERSGSEGRSSHDSSSAHHTPIFFWPTHIFFGLFPRHFVNFRVLCAMQPCSATAWYYGRSSTWTPDESQRNARRRAIRKTMPWSSPPMIPMYFIHSTQHIPDLFQLITPPKVACRAVGQPLQKVVAAWQNCN